MAIKKILVSQPKPENVKSPYFELEHKYNVSLVFQPLIQLVPIASKDFRKSKIDIAKRFQAYFTPNTVIKMMLDYSKKLKSI